MPGRFAAAASQGEQGGPAFTSQKSQLASLALTAAVFVTILLLTGLFENLPEATLGAIVIHAVWHLIDFARVTRYLKVRRHDFHAGLAALLGVLLFDILIGLIVAVAVSFLLILARVSRPSWSILGRTRDETADDVAFASLETRPTAETFPGLLIVRFDADLFFANANVFADDVREAFRASVPRPSVILLDAESISDIDTTAMMTLRDLCDELAGQGVELWAARVKRHVREEIGRFEELELGGIYPTIRAGVAAFEARRPGER